MFLTIQSVFKPQTADIIRRISTGAAGTQASGDSNDPQISPDGRYVLFRSEASDLVAGDTNGEGDIFLKDMATGAITRISTAAGGGQSDGDSNRAQFSPDGRYVLFESDAGNLIPGDTNGVNDLFVKDLITGAVSRISVTSTGGEANGTSRALQLSADGRYVVFESSASNLVDGDTNGLTDVFRKDLVTGAVIRISTGANGAQATGSSYAAGVSADGRYAVFVSFASDLVAGDTNSLMDVFRKDLVTGQIVRVSTAADGTQANQLSDLPQISADGRYVIFHSDASNLIPGDTNGTSDVFLKDLVTGAITRVSVDANGSQANNHSSEGRFSADGRYVLFRSEASNLVSGDTNGQIDIFRKDLVTGEVVRLSAAADGTQTNAVSNYAQFSPDGRYVVFESDASNLVAGDTNGDADIFRVDLLYKANAAAIAEGRFVEVKLGTGAASSATIAWATAPRVR